MKSMHKTMKGHNDKVMMHMITIHTLIQTCTHTYIPILRMHTCIQKLEAFSDEVYAQDYEGAQRQDDDAHDHYTYMYIHTYAHTGEDTQFTVCIYIYTHIHTYIHTYTHTGEDASNRRTGPPKELETTMSLLNGCTSSIIHRYIHTYIHTHTGEDTSNRRTGPPKELETTMSLLNGCTSSMISGQWSPLEVMMHKALDDETPRLMAHLQMYAALNPGTELIAERLRIGALERLQSTERSLEALLPEVDLILIRVQSCFDFEVSVSK
jgi:hypothetical protein